MIDELGFDCALGDGEELAGPFNRIRGIITGHEILQIFKGTKELRRERALDFLPRGSAVRASKPQLMLSRPQVLTEKTCRLEAKAGGVPLTKDQPQLTRRAVAHRKAEWGFDWRCRAIPQFAGLDSQQARKRLIRDWRLIKTFLRAKRACHLGGRRPRADWRSQDNGGPGSQRMPRCQRSMRSARSAEGYPRD